MTLARDAAAEPSLPVEASGLVQLEADLVRAVATAKPRATTLDVIERVLRMRGGVGSRESVHAALSTLSLPLRLNFPLFVFYGNGGTWDDGADEPQNTRIGLTEFGKAAADAATGTGPPIPWDLLNGSFHRAGSRAGFTPTGVAHAAEQVQAGEVIDTRFLDVMVASHGLARGDLGALVAGGVAEFEFSPRLERNDSGFVVTGVPPRTSPRHAAALISRKYLVPATDLTTGNEVRVEVWVPPEGGGERLAPLLAGKEHPLTERYVLDLGQPLNDFLSEWQLRHGPDSTRAGMDLMIKLANL